MLRVLSTSSRRAGFWSPLAGRGKQAGHGYGDGMGATAKCHRFVSSAHVPSIGASSRSQHSEGTPASRPEAYPGTYHMGLFPWLLSAERQRIPADDLDAHASDILSADAATHGSRGAIGQVLRCAPLPIRRRLAHGLNMHIARAALGAQAMDDVCQGAGIALSRVAHLLSTASSGGSDVAGELAQLFTQPLLERYTSDLRRLHKDHVKLLLEITAINGAQIRQLRTKTGPTEAFAALEAMAGQGAAAHPRLSDLRARLAHRNYQYSRTLGAVRAAPASNDGCLAASPAVRVRVDVELNVDMRYRLLGASKVIVDDNATRNLMLSLESTQRQGSRLEWRVADIDYLLSSEQRIQQEFEEAQQMAF
ncbi:hypothetical protein GGI02_004003 [Coemansia sp. RSA 2322]|nr:hypothetical protein GGI02_004003 [Coemansia sp. RSA 2322]